MQGTEESVVFDLSTVIKQDEQFVHKAAQGS